MTFRKIWSLVQYEWKFSNFIFGSIWHIWWYSDFGGYSHFWEFSIKNTQEFHVKELMEQNLFDTCLCWKRALDELKKEGAFEQIWIMFINRCTNCGLGTKYFLSAPSADMCIFNLTLNQFSDILPRASSGFRWSVKIEKWGRRDLIKIYCLLHSSEKWVNISKLNTE